MVQPCRLAQLCQLMPDEVDCEGDAEDCLCPKDSQELLAAVAILPTSPAGKPGRLSTARATWQPVTDNMTDRGLMSTDNNQGLLAECSCLDSSSGRLWQSANRKSSMLVFAQRLYSALAHNHAWLPSKPPGNAHCNDHGCMSDNILHNADNRGPEQ